MKAPSLPSDYSRCPLTRKTSCFKWSMAHTILFSRQSLLVRPCSSLSRRFRKGAGASLEYTRSQSLSSSPRTPRAGAHLPMSPNHYKEAVSKEYRDLHRLRSAASASSGSEVSKKSTASLLVRSDILCIFGAFDNSDLNRIDRHAIGMWNSNHKSLTLSRKKDDLVSLYAKLCTWFGWPEDLPNCRQALPWFLSLLLEIVSSTKWLPSQWGSIYSSWPSSRHLVMCSSMAQFCTLASGRPL